MDQPQTGRCRSCGATLDPRLRFCTRCGTPIRVNSERAASAIRVLCFASAAGAIFFLVMLAQTAAALAAPHGREALLQALAQNGVPPNQLGPVLTVYGSLFVGLLVALAALHGVAYFALRRRRLAGWVIAMALAQLWSLVLIGILPLMTLLRADVRREFGMEA